MLKRAALAAAATAGAVIGLAAPAAAAAPVKDAQADVAWVNDNVFLSADGSSATVLGKYRCSGGQTGTHLWVSVKQGPGIDAEHTTSDYASAWYDTNYNYAQDPAGLTVNCDGRWHVSRITLKPVFGALTAGSAYVQWCMFDSAGGYDAVQEFQTVKVNH
jgi:hypothetical protein